MSPILSELSSATVEGAVSMAKERKEAFETEEGDPGSVESSVCGLSSIFGE